MAATYAAAEELAHGNEHGNTGVVGRFKIDWRPGDLSHAQRDRRDAER